MSINDYQILDVIYANEYGQIKLVSNKETNSLNLMKTMSKRFLKYNNEEEAINEIKKFNSLDHTNLAAYKNFFSDENNFYLIMEYDEGSEIKEKINYNLQNHLSFDENYLWSLTKQILYLLKLMKENPDIEFNFTSVNILLMNDGSLKLYDYNKNYLNLPFNDESWMQDLEIIPPEIFDEKNKKIDKNAENVWKGGCIIYKLCMLHPPFTGRSTKDLFFNILKGSFAPINSKYDNDFNILIKKMIVVDPSQRATVEELLDNEIIKRRNIDIENKNQSDNNMDLFTFKKTSLKESKRQKESQREMMENDQYEIMKFTLSQKSQAIKEEAQNLEDLISTGHFNMVEAFMAEKNNNLDNFRARIIEAQEKQNKNKILIEDNNINLNSNNPYQNENIINNNIINNNNNNKNNLINFSLNPNQKKKNNLNKKHLINENSNNNISSNRFKNKNLISDNDILLNHVKKERQRTPILGEKRVLILADGQNQKNVNHNNNKIKLKENKNNNKKIFLRYPQNNNKMQVNPNINVIKSNNEIKPGTNKRNEIIEKTEKILNNLNGNKKEKKKFNSMSKKNKFPMMSNMMPPYPKELNVDKIISQILNKNKQNNFKANMELINKNSNKIANKDNLNLNFKYGNNNNNKKAVVNNYLMNKIPAPKPISNLPNITYGQNKKVKIEYGILKLNNNNKRVIKKK